MIIHEFLDDIASVYLYTPDQIEACVKGLLQELSNVDTSESMYYIAITNLPSGFISNLRNIIISLSTRLFSEKVQLFLAEKKLGKTITLFGNNFNEMIYNSHILSVEQGEEGFTRQDCRRARRIYSLLMAEDVENNNVSVVDVCPFDALINDGEYTYFEKKLAEIAENPLDDMPSGYKLHNTHMRLGSKVHLDSFYEMSFMFYRTTVANRIALIVLRRLAACDEPKHIEDAKDIVLETDTYKGEMLKRIDLISDPLIFYGYASYSKAILNSLTEILKCYRCSNTKNVESYSNSYAEDDKGYDVGYAAFQYNLASDIKDVQVYFGLPEDFPQEQTGTSIMSFTKKIKIIQVVPISTTLTTFAKMWEKILNYVNNDYIELYSNITMFWVNDGNGNIENGLPSKIEEKYWIKTYHKQRLIYTNLAKLNKDKREWINYMVCSPVIWNDPLRKEKSMNMKKLMIILF